MTKLEIFAFMFACAYVCTSCGTVPRPSMANIGPIEQVERDWAEGTATQRLIDEGKFAEAKLKVAEYLRGHRRQAGIRYGLQIAKLEGDAAQELAYHRMLYDPSDEKSEFRTETSPRRWTDYGESALKNGEVEEAKKAFESAIRVAQPEGDYNPKWPKFTPQTRTFDELRASSHVLSAREIYGSDDSMFHLLQAMSVAPHMDYPKFYYGWNLARVANNDFRYVDHGLAVWRGLVNSTDPKIRDFARQRVRQLVITQGNHPKYKRELQFSEFVSNRGGELPNWLRGWRP